jgi:hypothetical protein
MDPKMDFMSSEFIDFKGFFADRHVRFLRRKYAMLNIMTKKSCINYDHDR